MELFVAAQASDKAARTLAKRFSEAFVQMGSAAGRVGNISLAKDPFLHTLSGAAAVQRWVVGVRRAPDAVRAGAELKRLREAIESMPQSLKERAHPTAAGEAAAERSDG